MSLIKIDATKIAAAQQSKVNAEARAYLASTDWYVIRFQETAVAVPADIASARQAARDSIKEQT
tara:strand:+ start:4595 stop:4786 length:192 start_codon:yes stop_codon:yes gene_type:complete